MKKTSPNYKMGINIRGKASWLEITGFRTKGDKNFRVKAINGFRDGFAEFKDIWVGKDDIILKHIDEKQYYLELYSPEEFEKQKYNPKLFNSKRFEVITKTEKQYIHARDIEMANQVAKEYGLTDYKIRQVKRLTKKEIEE